VLVEVRVLLLLEERVYWPAAQVHYGHEAATDGLFLCGHGTETVYVHGNGISFYDFVTDPFLLIILYRRW